MAVDFTQLARPEVQGMHPYVPGKPVEEAQRELGLSSMVKLASNENPRGPSPAVLDAIKNAAASINRYPDGNGFYLKAALAEFNSVASASVTLGNGSNDVLELIASAYLSPGDNAVFSQHAFVVYALATARSGASAKVVPAKEYAHDLIAIAQAIDEKTRVVFLANPNNPTGSCFSSAELETFLAKTPANVVVVLDEAYLEYAIRRFSDENANGEYPNGEYPDSISLLSQFPNLVITRTFSKAYGLSGLRIGYGLSNPQVADILNRVRQPFNVSSIALAGAQAALADQAYIENSIAINAIGLRDMEAFFRSADIDYIPSYGNFITFSTDRFSQSAAELDQALLRKGVIVRPIAAYQMPNFLRVSVGLESENAKFFEVLQELIGA